VPVNTTLRFIALIGAAVVLTLLTMVFGALPMLMARRAYGRRAYWFGFVFAAVLMAVGGVPFYALALIALTVLVGVYVEMEEHRATLFVSGLGGVLASTGLIVLSAGIWVRAGNLKLTEELRKALEPLVAQLARNTSTNVGVDAVLQQLPSAVVIMLSVALVIALIGERRTGKKSLSLEVRGKSETMGNETSQEVFVRPSGLSAFRVPDLMIWLTILAIAGAFIKLDQPTLETVSINILNFLFVLYFFQGLAVFAHAFRIFKVGSIWRTLWYVILVVQLFLMVSLLGFIDYWLDFRERLSRKPVETNREF
jgi:hypothetical protein